MGLRLFVSTSALFLFFRFPIASFRSIAKLRDTGRLTVTVVAEVDELVVPLGHDAESIFQEGDDDEEAANGGKVAAQRRRIELAFGIVPGSRVIDP